MIQNIITGQKAEFERKLREPYVQRETVIKGLTTDLISVVIGPRRAGKSFFSIHSAGIMTGVGYANFDEERLLKVANFDEIISAIRSVYGDPKTLLFDEIQNLDRWEIIVNRLHRDGYKLILTGSNSHLLGSELATHLTGRHFSTHLFTFSFREVMSLLKDNPTDADKQQRCFEYVTKGGFPEVWVKNYDPVEYLSTLFDSIILKDIVKRYRVRYPNALVDLAQTLITYMTGEFSSASIQKLANISSVHTSEKYIGYLEEAFLLFSIPRFSFKVKEQQKSGKKIYCYDNGFFQAKAFRFSQNTGKLFENAVAVELRRREMEGKCKIFYYKNQKQEEVDFVIQQGLKIKQLIQVCYSLSEPKVKDREIRGLLKASAELECHNLIIITNDLEATEKHSWFGHSGEIKFIPLWKWLLTDIGS
ncbi:MAG: ATP-binding protein [Bacteroidetes bacterium]|nr:ATP-binding protein [Bacteroidota bacterium]